MINQRHCFASSCWCLTVCLEDGLAINGNAPKIFTRINRWGLPYVAVATNSIFVLLAFMAASSSAGRVFGWWVPDT